MHAPVAVRRQAYRIAYVVMAVYWFVVRPKVRGVKCVLTDGEHLLLVRHTYGRRGWDLPGGSMRRHETPVETARREMEEELGVAIDEWHELGSLSSTAFRRRDTVHCLQAELGDRELKLDHGELDTARWFHRAELPDQLGVFVTPIVALAQIPLRGSGQLSMS